MFLFKMENVIVFSDSLESQPKTWRWYVSEHVGAVRISDGFLQSKEDCVHLKMALIGPGMECIIIGLDLIIVLLTKTIIN